MAVIMPKEIVAISEAPDAALYIIKDVQGEDVIIHDIRKRRTYSVAQYQLCCEEQTVSRSDCKEPTKEQLSHYVTRSDLHKAIKDSLLSLHY